MTTNTPARRDRTNRRKWWTLKRRRWAFGVAIAAVPVAAAFEIGTNAQHVALIGLAAAVLGVSTLALANPKEDAPAE